MPGDPRIKSGDKGPGVHVFRVLRGEDVGAQDPALAGQASPGTTRLRLDDVFHKVAQLQ